MPILQVRACKSFLVVELFLHPVPAQVQWHVYGLHASSAGCRMRPTALAVPQ